MLLSTILGTLAAYGLQALRSRWSVLAYGAFTLPLVIPAILIAIGIFLFYAQFGLNNTLTGIVLAHSVLAIPLVVITVASSLKSYDMNQEMVARSLGASRPWAFLTVTLPQIRISVDLGRAAGLHHIARRGGDLAVHRRGRQSDTDQAYVQRATRRDRSDHRLDLDVAHRAFCGSARPEPVRAIARENQDLRSARPSHRSPWPVPRRHPTGPSLRDAD